MKSHWLIVYGFNPYVGSENLDRLVKCNFYAEFSNDAPTYDDMRKLEEKLKKTCGYNNIVILNMFKLSFLARLSMS